MTDIKTVDAALSERERQSERERDMERERETYRDTEGVREVPHDRHQDNRCGIIREHISIRQHTSAYVSIRTA